jgi:uncharacterized protein
VSLVFVAGFIALLPVMDYSKNWEWESLTYRNLWTPEGILRNLFYDGFRSVFPWAGLFVAGMWLGRLDLANSITRRRLLVISASILVGAVALSRGLVHFATTAWQMSVDEATFLFGTVSMPPLPLFLLTGLGFAGTVIALCLWLAERFPNHFLVRALVATGRMAFTWYIGHIFLGLGGVILLGLHGTQPPALAVATGSAFFVLAMVISTFWMKRFRNGPLEGLLRRVAG